MPPWDEPLWLGHPKMPNIAHAFGHDVLVNTKEVPEGIFAYQSSVR